MTLFRTKSRVLCAEIEANPGEDATPTIDDAVFAENTTWPVQLRTVSTNENILSLDTPAPTPAGGSRNATARVYFRGPGTGAAGQPPDFSKLLRACSFGERLLAAAVTGTFAAATSTTATLPGTASAVLNFYKGMLIRTITGTGAGQTRMIKGYTTGRVATVIPNWTVTPDATTTFSIDACARYVPQSSLLETASIYGFERASDGGLARLGKVLGAAGNAVITANAADNCFVDFNFQGLLTGDLDETDPGSPTFPNQRRIPFLNAQCYFDNTSQPIQGITVDLGAQVTTTPDPRALYGTGPAAISQRTITGTVTPPKLRVSDIDLFADWASNAEHTLAAWWGPSAGHRVGILVDGLAITDFPDRDVNGITFNDIRFATLRADDSVYLLYA